MEEKSLYNSQQAKGITENLQNFIDSMVEEIVLEGKAFDTQKKYLKKFSENEGVDYNKLETDIATFIDILEGIKDTHNELLEKYASEKAKDCYISEEKTKWLILHSSQLRWNMEHFSDYITGEMMDFYYMSPPKYPNDKSLNEVGKRVGIPNLANNVHTFIQTSHGIESMSDHELKEFYFLGIDIKLKEDFIFGLLGNERKNRLLRYMEMKSRKLVEHGKRIVINDMTSTGIDSDFANIQSIDIEEQPFSEGKNGRLFHCIGINGRACKNPQVIKIFKDNEDRASYNTIKGLQEGLIRKKAVLDASRHINFLTYYPALFAVPQFVFEGLLDGRPVRGYSANDLKPHSYCCLDDVLYDNDKADIYDGISMNSRFAKAYHLMHALELLLEINYVPTNLRTYNIFVSLKDDDRCAIIDFDEGTFVNSQVAPSYIRGSFHDMIAPENYRQLKENGCIIANTHAEKWSAAVACHYLLFLIHPFGFLTEVTGNSILAYKERFVWPNVDDSFSFFDADNGREVADYIKKCCDALPHKVHECFKQTFTRGCLYPDVRTSFSEWCASLKSEMTEHK